MELKLRLWNLKYLCDRLSNKMDWSQNTDVFYRKGQNRFYR